MHAQRGPVGRDQQQPRADKRRKQRHHAEVPHLRCVQAGDARGALRQEQSHQHAQRSDGSIRWNEDRAEMEENRMHLSKNSASGEVKGRSRPTGP